MVFREKLVEANEEEIHDLHGVYDEKMGKMDHEKYLLENLIIQIHLILYTCFVFFPVQGKILIDFLLDFEE